MIEVLDYYLKFSGAQFILKFFIFLFLYFCFRLFLLCLDYFVLKKDTHSDKIQSFITGVFLIFAVLSIYFFLAFMLAGILLEKIVTHPTPSSIAHFDALYMALDKEVFRTYVPFWFSDISNPLKHYFDMSSIFLIRVYMSLATVIGFLFFFTLAKGDKIFYETILSFFLCIFLSMPFWYFFPALSPLEGYVDNIVSAQIAPEIKEVVVRLDPPPDLEKFFGAIREIRKVSEDSFFAVTTMPSMHVAWSIVILYFGALIWRPSLFFLIPYSLLNIIAAIYTLQHYAVDAIGGIFVALFAIFLAKKIASAWVPGSLQKLSEFLKGDIENLKTFFYPSGRGGTRTLKPFGTRF